VTAPDIQPLAVDIKGLAAALKVSDTTAKVLIRTGEIPSIKIGRSRRIRMAAIEEYLAAKEAETCTPVHPEDQPRLRAV
jgi:excisionase family DNA binding protein